MRLDHLLSKECCRPDLGPATTEVERWLLGVMAIPGGWRTASLSRKGASDCPFQERSAGSPSAARGEEVMAPGFRSSVLRERPSGHPSCGDAARAFLGSAAARPIRADARAVVSRTGMRAACRAVL